MTRDLISQFRLARTAKKWSQRDLSERTRVPQAHISRIESGAVDPRLSTLRDLARVLDLELTLIPRRALAAMDLVVRESESEADRERLRQIGVNMNKAAETLQAMAGGLNDRVADVATDLARFDPADVPQWVRAGVVAAAEAVDVAIKGHSIRDLEPTTATLQAVLTDAATLARPNDARPAYTLDDED